MVVGSYHLRSLIRVLHAFVVVVGGKKEREGGGGRIVKAHKSKAGLVFGTFGWRKKRSCFSR